MSVQCTYTNINTKTNITKISIEIQITINENTPKLNKVSITTTAIKYDYE